MTTANSESSTVRIPGRDWTVRLTGHTDRSATVTCTAACRMPARSRDLATLRRFAAQHAAAHAKVATVRPNAACHCRSRRCDAHPADKVHCGGAVVMVLRHDPSVGQVWIVEEICESCAPLIPHARVLARAAAPARPAAVTPASQVPAPARADMTGLFSSAGAAADSGRAAVKRPRSGSGRPRRRPGPGSR